MAAADMNAAADDVVADVVAVVAVDMHTEVLEPECLIADIVVVVILMLMLLVVGLTVAAYNMNDPHHPRQQIHHHTVHPFLYHYCNDSADKNAPDDDSTGRCCRQSYKTKEEDCEACCC
jgi:hypothetical protein